MVVLVADRADKLLGDVFQRDDAGKAAILIHHTRHLAMPGPQPVQHRRQRQRRRHQQRGYAHVPHRRGRALARRHFHHVGDAYHAHHVVDAVGAPHGEPRVAGLQQVDDATYRLVGTDGVHVDARHHHLARGEPPEVQPAVEQRGDLHVEVPLGAGLRDDLLQVFGGGAGRQLLDRLDADPPQQPGRGQVEDPDHRAEHGQVEQRGPAQPPGERLRAGDGQVFRSQLAEHHLHDGGDEQDQHDRDRQADRLRHARRTQQVGEPLADEGLRDVPDQQHRHGDAELRPGQHERQPPGHLERPRGGGVALAGEAAQLAAIHRDVAELLRDEVAGEGGEQQDEQETDRDQHDRLTNRRGSPGSVLLPSWAVVAIMGASYRDKLDVSCETGLGNSAASRSDRSTANGPITARINT
ncbi:hypothetical protein Prum_025220 [Phytohabitans rumicis]|uniref:Uncharacterized protein n=1 Tax=Phytohabitans rumicis TaxID=1076125 RepID=A0A6V8KZV5_9ACTN|nr:hypothetical protein Prum_025220 [Phytohabitans rumicis]